MNKFSKAFILMAIYFISFQISHTQVLDLQSFKLLKVLDCIDNFYVDTVNTEKVVEKAIIEMLEELDPHSSYLNSKEVKEMNEPLQGNFEGIGVSFNILNDTLFIINVIPGGPSEKVGVMAGDRIILIDDVNIAGIGITNSDVFKKLRGTKGTIVKISTKRRGYEALIDFTIVRDKIPIFSIDASYMIDKETGYIKLNRFSQTTSDEIQKSISKLKNEKCKNIILDLTGNGGGYLEEAVALADRFLTAGKLIVYTEGVNSLRKDYSSTSKTDFESGKLVVLIDENSASASEIVAGAIQDWDRGLIVGRRSFGKGLVQRPIPLPDGSMIRLTVARYYTPSGRLIQKAYNKGSKEYEKDLLNRYNHGEFLNKDSIKFTDTLRFNTMLKKRIVYGGGGIMPDLFVPIDTTEITDYYRQLVRKGILNKFVLNYVDTRRVSLLLEYKSFKDYQKKYTPSEIDIQKLINLAESEGLPYNETQFKTSIQQVKLLIKAYIARDLWDSNEFYQIINQNNEVVQKAIEAIRSNELP